MVYSTLSGNIGFLECDQKQYLPIEARVRILADTLLYFTNITNFGGNQEQLWPIQAIPRILANYYHIGPPLATVQYPHPSPSFTVNKGSLCTEMLEVWMRRRRRIKSKSEEP